MYIHMYIYHTYVYIYTTRAARRGPLTPETQPASERERPSQGVSRTPP